MSTPEILFDGRLFRVVRQMYQATDGATHVREIVQHPGAVAILPILEDGRICLIENFRLAAGKVLLELPAGTREEDEPPEVTARRELAEETGYRAGSLQRLTSFFMSPGILDERMHLYLATDLTPGEMDPQGGEQITPRPTGWEEVVRMIHDGRIEDSKTLVGLLYYGMFCR